MADEIIVCAAAFFLSRGKDVVAAKEFVMGVSLDLRWMSVKDAERLSSVLVDKGVLKRSGDLLKPSGDLSSVDVPAAYRPSAALLESLHAEPAPAEADDILGDLVGAAVSAGANKGKFIAECNRTRKRLGINMETAALVHLRDLGVDVGVFVDRVRNSVTSSL
ncbi:MAG: DUF2240 family protein [Candidatus Methanoplasma sp.]|jgi:hypothetical protein|nr:DUF2240 family protein [Candidatus Methanoplasma sp.]